MIILHSESKSFFKEYLKRQKFGKLSDDDNRSHFYALPINILPKLYYLKPRTNNIGVVSVREVNVVFEHLITFNIPFFQREDLSYQCFERLSRLKSKLEHRCSHQFLLNMDPYETSYQDINLVLLKQNRNRFGDVCDPIIHGDTVLDMHYLNIHIKIDDDITKQIRML